MSEDTKQIVASNLTTAFYVAELLTAKGKENFGINIVAFEPKQIIATYHSMLEGLGDSEASPTDNQQIQDAIKPEF